MKQTNNFLKTFFDEKQIKHEVYEIEANNNTHMISTEVVIESIFSCDKEEMKQIEMIIRKIDFHNGNIEHFLQHLAQGLAQAY